MKVLLLATLVFTLSCSSGGKTRQQLKLERIAKQEAEWKKKEALRLKNKNSFKKASDYTMEERFYFDNKWAVTVFDGVDATHMKFPTPFMKFNFGPNGECTIGPEVMEKFGTYTKHITCPEVKKKLTCTDSLREPDEEKKKDFCKMSFNYKGEKITLSVTMMKFFHRDYWRQKSRQFEENHKGFY